MHVEVRGQLCGAHALLPSLCGIQRSDLESRLSGLCGEFLHLQSNVTGLYVSCKLFSGLKILYVPGHKACSHAVLPTSPRGIVRAHMHVLIHFHMLGGGNSKIICVLFFLLVNFTILMA